MKEVRPLIAFEHFNVETIKGKNSAAAGVTGFILNIVIYYDIVVTVEPKRKAFAEANAQLEAANTKLAEVNALVKDLTEKLAVLTKELNEAMADKAQVREVGPSLQWMKRPWRGFVEFEACRSWTWPSSDSHQQL